MGILFPQRTALGCYKGLDKVYHNLGISLHHALVETQDIASGFTSGDLASGFITDAIASQFYTCQNYQEPKTPFIRLAFIS